MRQKRGLRFKNGSARGGLGYAGFVAPLAPLVCLVLDSRTLAVVVALASVLVCPWCAIGLRRDDAAGEGADRYTTSGKGLRLMDIVTGQWESERRISTDLLVTSLVVLVITVIFAANRH